MKKSSLFLTNLFLSAVRFGVLIFPAVILMIIGAIWSQFCLKLGLAILVLYVIICLISAILMQRLLYYRSEDNPEFNKLMDSILEVPHKAMAEIMKAGEEHKKLHGEELNTLTDDDLFDTVYAQNLDISEAAQKDGDELALFNEARRTVYVLSLFDAEIQNGGLCQFFVNSTKEVAPFVSECLERIEAHEHRALFEDFIKENQIDVSNRDSFLVFSRRGYMKQTKRFDFDAFDDKYYELPPLQGKVVDYIRTNIVEF